MKIYLRVHVYTCTSHVHMMFVIQVIQPSAYPISNLIHAPLVDSGGKFKNIVNSKVKIKR